MKPSKQACCMRQSKSFSGSAHQPMPEVTWFLPFSASAQSLPVLVLLLLLLLL
jgi:hypothetical protein